MAAEPTDKPPQRTAGVLVLFDTRQSETPRTRRQRWRVNRHGLRLRTARAIALQARQRARGTRVATLACGCSYAVEMSRLPNADRA
jgi:hypothetical protein